MSAEIMPWAEVEIEVPFHDIDSMGIVWHGRYPKYLEVARCKLMEELGYSHANMGESGYIWPVIDMKIRYPKPLRFGQVVTVRCEIAEFENRLRLKYLIEDKLTGQRTTRAETIQVAVSFPDQEMQIASPPILEEKILEWRKCNT